MQSYVYVNVLLYGEIYFVGKDNAREASADSRMNSPCFHIIVNSFHGFVGLVTFRIWFGVLDHDTIGWGAFGSGVA